MDRGSWQARAKYGAAVVLLLLVGGCMIVDRNGQSIVLRAVDVPESSSLTALRLLATPDGVQLLTSKTQSTAPGGPAYTTVIFAGPLTDPRRSSALFTLGHLLPAPLHWDVMAHHDRSYSVAYEMAGGALNAIVVQRTSGQRVAVSREHPFESFSRPHFVSGASDDAPPAVVAVAEPATLVLFPGAAPGAYRRLGDCAEGQAIARPDGWLLVCKRIAAGPASGNVLRGTLYLQRLDRDLQPVGAPVTPMGDVGVYEFACSAVAKRLALLAVTERGLVLALESAAGDTYDGRVINAGRESRALTSPSLAATESTLYLAALARPGTDQARVLVGTAPADALRE